MVINCFYWAHFSKKCISTFKASPGWCTRFMNRNSLTLRERTKIFPIIFGHLFFTSTYTRVSNFGQHLSSEITIRLIRGATYTRVYTVYIIFEFFQSKWKRQKVVIIIHNTLAYHKISHLGLKIFQCSPKFYKYWKNEMVHSLMYF